MPNPTPELTAVKGSLAARGCTCPTDYAGCGGIMSDCPVHDPTPNLTAEECACGRSTRCCPAWQDQDASVRRKAFKEAAEGYETIKRVMKMAEKSGHKLSVLEADALVVATDAIRALAKEKGG